MKPFLLLFALLGNLFCVAQYTPLGAITMPTDGYVVTTQNDTIRGQVMISTLVNDSPASVVVKTASKEKVKFKGDELQQIFQRVPRFAYALGSIPKEREAVIFERVPNPRRDGKLTLLERLTPSVGLITLYFDVSGWKKTTSYSFGEFTISDREELSYVAVKNSQPPFLVKRGAMADSYANLFGDCPVFVREYPLASRQDWKYLGEMITAYNQLCR